MDFEKTRIIQVPKICDPRGNLSFMESFSQIPFEIHRTYWIYYVPAGMVRHGHAFKTQEEVVIAISGSLDLVVRDGKDEKLFHMSRSNYGLYIPNLMWREINNFSTNSVALVISSDLYNANDYIEDYAEYRNIINNETR